MSCWALADKSFLPAYPRLPKTCSFADAGGVSHEDVHSQRQDETECDEVNADSDSHARDYPLRPAIMRSRAPPWLRGRRKEDPRSPGDLIDPNLLGQWVTTADSLGMSVVGWYLPTLDEPRP